MPVSSSIGDRSPRARGATPRAVASLAGALLVAWAAVSGATRAEIDWPHTPRAEADSQRAPADTPRAPADTPRAPSDSSRVDPRSPLAALHEIEAAWRRADVRALIAHLGPGRVTIALDAERRHRSNTYSRDQAFFVFRDLFRSTRTVEFAFAQVRTNARGRRTCSAVARWRYRRVDDGRERRGRVFVSLRREAQGDGARWVIDEIQAIR